MVEGTIKFYPKFNRSYYIFTYFNFFITKTLVFKSHQFKLKITVKNGRFRETVQVKNKSCVLLRIILYSGIGRPPPPRITHATPSFSSVCAEPTSRCWIVANSVRKGLFFYGLPHESSELYFTFYTVNAPLIIGLLF